MRVKTRARVRRAMDRLAAEITRSMKEQPDAFDERERLWMEREELRAWHTASVERPSLIEKLAGDIFGPTHMTVGVGCATFIITAFNSGGGWSH